MDILGAYWIAARASAAVLSSSSAVESVLVHRSVTTGEVVFGRSDIDLVLVLNAQAAGDGPQLASLYRLVRLVRRLNPALSHIDVYEPGGMARHARDDSCLASIERRSLRLLRGKPASFPDVPLQRDHAVARFVLWAEWFFAIALQARNGRNIRKIALEMWNAYAVAEGLIPEPLLRRDEMQRHVIGIEGPAAAQHLHEPSSAFAFVYSLAGRLHRSRLPELRRLADPLVFDAVTAPIGLRRAFVVLPGPESPLPGIVFARPGVFPCTPELLDLHMNTRNAYLNWSMPSRLLDLGMTRPDAAHYLTHSLRFNDDRFLRVPGFASPHNPGPAVIARCIRHALPYLQRGEAPPPMAQEEVLAFATGIPSIEDYYRNEYDGHRREVLALRAALEAVVC